MDRANSAFAAMAPGAAESLRATPFAAARNRAGGFVTDTTKTGAPDPVQLDLLGGPAVPAALTPAYEPAPPPAGRRGDRGEGRG